MAHQISAAVFEDACRDLELTPAQFGVLTVLQAHPGLGQSSLARALGFDKVTVLRVLRGLQARGLVNRVPAEDNRRNVSVGTSACTASTKLDERRMLRSVIGPTRMLWPRSCNGIWIAVCSITADSERRRSATTGAKLRCRSSCR